MSAQDKTTQEINARIWLVQHFTAATPALNWNVLEHATHPAFLLALLLGWCRRGDLLVERIQLFFRAIGALEHHVRHLVAKTALKHSSANLHTSFARMFRLLYYFFCRDIRVSRLFIKVEKQFLLSASA